MSVFDTADELFLTLSVSGTVLACSALRSRGETPSPAAVDLIGADFVAMLPGPHRQAMLTLLADVAETGQAVTQDLRLDGRQDSFQCTLSVLHEGAGTAGIACLLRNQAAIPQPAVDRFDQALSLARVAWFERDLRTDIGIGSPSLAQIYGLEHPRGPWHFDEVRARIVPEDRELHSDEILSGLQRRSDDLETRTLNYRICRPDGTIRHLEVRYRNLYNQDRPRAYGLIFDVTEAKQIEEQLVESQNWLNLALGSAGITLWDNNLATSLVRTSVNFGRFIGRPQARTMWRHEDLIDTIDEDSRPVFLAALQAWQRGDTTPRPRFSVHGSDGRQRWIEANGNVEFDDEGRPARLFGVSWDVTAAVEEIRLRKASDERLARIADLVPGVVFQFKRNRDGQYSIPYASRGIRDVFDLRADAVRADASPIFAMVHPDDRATLIESIEHSARTLSYWQHEYRIVRTDGSTRWVFGTAMPQREADDTVLWHGHNVDATERHEAQQRLRESETRLTLALSAARMSSWHWDLGSDTMNTTRALGEMLGLAATAVPSEKVFELVHPDDVAAMRDCFTAAATDQASAAFSVDYRFRGPDGEYRWVELRARAIRDEQGKVIAFDGVTSDITERRRAEGERERLQRQLSQAQKMEAIGLLTGGIAHDFNNILASVLGYSSLALQRFGNSNPPKLSDYLAEVIKAGERARDLVAQMLAFSRGESSEVAQVDVEPLVEQIMKMLRPTLPSSIEIRLDIATDLPPLQANAVQIQQVLLNLCINARDAMNAVGIIVVSARRHRFPPTDCASCHKSFSGDYVVLSVTDDGMGITEAQRTRIFEPFFTTKTTQKGTGMGLATVHGIVHRHGGHLGLVSTVAVGSTFSVALPAAAGAPTATAIDHGTQQASALAAWPARILVVDDEASIARCTAEMLEIAGFEVEVETDSQHAEARLIAAPDAFDLLITDQTMPRLTGHQLALSAMSARPDLPVLLVTGHSAIVDENQALALGIRAFLRKPVARETLLQTVNRVLSDADAKPKRA